ncbi:type IV pilus assembly protein PilM [Patescibacteria group bacterium]|nr:type IV pilus assembly protein PilM [Patescibacteria group bacterium]
MKNYLSLEPEAFGIDFSDLNMRVAKLKKKGKFFDLTSWGEVKVPLGIIKDGEIQDEEKLTALIKKAIKEVRGEKIKTKYVVASLPETKAFLQVIKVPKMNEEELKTAIPFEVENYIPLLSDQTYLDYEVIYSTSQEGDILDVLIGAMPKKIVDPYLSCLRGAGLIPKALEVESQSIARALIKNGLSPFPYLIIDFGRTTTSFIVFSGYSLRFTSSISVSSEDLTQKIAKDFKIDYKEAEEMKIKYEKNITKSINPLILELIKQTKKYINFYHTHSNNISNDIGGGEIKKILLCGGGSNLKGLPEKIFSELKIPTELANPWINILPKDIKNPPAISFKDSLGYVTTLGLALRGMQEEL